MNTEKNKNYPQPNVMPNAAKIEVSIDPIIIDDRMEADTPASPKRRITIEFGEELNITRDLWDEAHEIYIDFGVGIFILEQFIGDKDPNKIGTPTFTSSTTNPLKLEKIEYESSYEADGANAVLAGALPGTSGSNVPYKLYLKPVQAILVDYDYNNNISQ